MSRIDRLTAILLLLQGKKRTAGEIAQHFEISRGVPAVKFIASCWRSSGPLTPQAIRSRYWRG